MLRSAAGARSLHAWTVATAIATAACATEVVDWDTLYLSVTAEATPAGTVTKLDMALQSLEGAAVPVKLPEKPNDPAFNFALPQGHALVSRPFHIKLASKTKQKLQVRVRGLDDKGAVLASWAGVVDTAQTGEVLVVLRAIDKQAVCDADGDGVLDCAKAGCCRDKNEATDCNDDPTPGKDGAKRGATASPFGFEDPCTQCGNGIDEDCKGGDEACKDEDKDGVPDCQEAACGTGADKDPAVKPGGIELCDGKDNDCNGQIDELPYKGFDGKEQAGLKKGDACPDAKGICKDDNPVIECAPAGANGASIALRCSTFVKMLPKEICDNKLDDDCTGVPDDGCSLKSADLDGDKVDNDAEDKACTFFNKSGKHAKFHAEVFPGAPEPCCKAGKMPEECDWNCDGKSSACDANDKDGDGVKAPADCDDANAAKYPGAPEKCGDGVVQACVGSDPACATVTDKDGDGWSPGCKSGQQCDCNDDNKAVHPEAKELCNAIDDDCDGIVDDGAPDADDAACGDKDGECGKGADAKYGQFTGIAVCKHFPKGEVSEPDPLDCLMKKFDKATAICVGCQGDNRPKKDECNYLDDNCDGNTDEDFSYTDEKGKKLGVLQQDGKPTACDGVGECGKGQIECRPEKDKAVCSTDPNGSKHQDSAETCNNKDDNCSGAIDEQLQAVSDSTCSQVGACSGPGLGAIKTVCVTGYWVCDYALVADIEFQAKTACKPGESGCHCSGLGQTCAKLIEASCDGKDNDCDGKTDDDFTLADWDDKPLPIGATCGTGACKDGKVVCAAQDKTKMACTTAPKSFEELCNASDDDCDGSTDELADASMNVVVSGCLLKGGVCVAANVVHICPKGKWECDYSKAKADGYEAGKELTCDAKDNDCDGKADEDFDFIDFNAVAKKIGEGCGTGACKGGKAVCTADKKALTCDALPKKTTDSTGLKEPACNAFDDDCDGKTDEDWPYKEQSGKSDEWGEACDGIGACGLGLNKGKGKVECAKSDQSTCSTDANGTASAVKPENVCDDLDNDCNLSVDEKCDDDTDGYCDKALTTVGTPKVCQNGGGDCQKGNKEVNPGAPEQCETNAVLGFVGIDNDCDGKTDEDFKWEQKPTGGVGTMLVVNDTCGLGECAGGKVVCTVDKKQATCSSLDKKKAETCNDKDDNCDGVVDEGCNKDGDDYCDLAMTVVGTPKVCAKGGGDCNDNAKAVFPGAPELCNDIDDGCSDGIDEKCDDDKDGFCDVNMTVVLVAGKAPKVCPKNADPAVKDCNDGAIKVFPGALETCNDIDDNCKDAVDEGCDDDKDKFCDANMTVEFNAGGAAPQVCPKTTPGAKDCNDLVNSINPDVAEVCDDIDQNCAGGADEGCDKDDDDYCDSKIAFIKSATCPKSKTGADLDCNDGNNAVSPGAAEKCNDIDDNCKLAVDEGCDDDDDDYCDAGLTVVGAPNTCKSGGGDCNDDVKQVHPLVTEVCDNIDNDCKGGIDEGCDDDVDGFCDKKMVVVAQPTICPNGGGDCDDGKNSINPKKVEACDTIDNNCDNDIDPQNSLGCTAFFKDFDNDKHGTGASKCLCEPDAVGKFTSIKGGDCDDLDNLINPLALEICNGGDDNCKDGSDEGFTYAEAGKNLAPGASCGLGACSGGKVFCKTTALAACTSSVNAGAETCNSKDDNCDGATDEPFSYTENAKPVAMGAVCGLGECKNGKVVCKDTASATCDSLGKGASEACNGKDDNCDGATDENFTYLESGKNLAQGAACGFGICASGKVGCKDIATAVCDTLFKAVGEACNNKDDDCDGATDEGFTYKQGQTDLVVGAACGVGPCANGKVICKDVEKTTCDSLGKSVTEACNGTDDDCDGSTDEGFTYTESGAPLAIGEKCGLGECKNGSVTCANTATATCNSLNKKTNEVCNAKDDDCNGATDTGILYAKTGCKQKGICLAESGNVVYTCSGGPPPAETCNYAAIPLYVEGTETCADGVDNDCDGAVDEGC
ncbi:MAG: hypothetical protein EXR79_10865 [Myxococcales bacterium]|nr:hypothetical protein [Myxococcales bacterium]